MINPQLTIELVPQTCWFSNVRNHVSQKTWDRLRKSTYRKANYQCEICGGKGNKHPVECHEIWHYDDQNQVQTLTGLIALCPQCHQVKHLGLAGIRGKREEAEQHLAKVNHWTDEQLQNYLTEVWSTWQQRSQYQWKLDLSWLQQEFGIKIETQR